MPLLRFPWLFNRFHLQFNQPVSSCQSQRDGEFNKRFFPFGKCLWDYLQLNKKLNIISPFYILISLKLKYFKPLCLFCATDSKNFRGGNNHVDANTILPS